MWPMVCGFPPAEVGPFTPDTSLRWTRSGVPDDVGFAAKPDLAKRLLTRAFAAGVPAAGEHAPEGSPGVVVRGEQDVVPRPGRRGSPVVREPGYRLSRAYRDLNSAGRSSGVLR
jgi:hypothetical protein